jgi:hypothetical protein
MEKQHVCPWWLGCAHINMLAQMTGSEGKVICMDIQEKFLY